MSNDGIKFYRDEPNQMIWRTCLQSAQSLADKMTNFTNNGLIESELIHTAIKAMMELEARIDDAQHGTLHTNGCTERLEDYPIKITWTDADPPAAMVSAEDGDWLVKQGLRRFFKCTWKPDAPADADPEYVVLQSTALGCEDRLTLVPYDEKHPGHVALMYETKRLSL